MDAIKPDFNISFCRLLAVLIPLCVICGCDGTSDTEKKVDEVASHISEQIADQTNKIGRLIPSKDEIHKTSNEQIEKTFAVEYKVVDIKSDFSSEQAQALLSELGKERWDCFAITPNLEGSRLTCKRRPISALRAILDAGGLRW